MQSVVETPDYLVDAKAAGMSADERAEIVGFLALNPTAGEVMVGTGGARKVRFRRPGTGKSGGYRVVTFYAGRDIPVFLLAVFTKGDRDNLSKAERNELHDVLAGMAVGYRKGRKK